MNLSSVPRTAPPTPAAHAHDHVAVPPSGRVPGAHQDAHARLTTDLTGGGEGRIRTETLDNGLRIIVAERPGASSTKIQVGIGAGSNQDPQGKVGLAHLLEHLAFEGSPTRSSTEQERARLELGGNWNAFTNGTGVVYYGVVPGAQAKQGASLLADMFRNPTFSGPQLAQERAAVKNEMVYWGGGVRDEANDISMRLLHGDHPAVNNIIGSRKTIDAITPKDLRDWHGKHFVGRNTVVLVEGDPKHLPLDTIRRELGKLEPGARIDQAGIEAPVLPGRAMQVINDPSVDTVQLNLMIPVPADKVRGAKTPASLLTTAINDKLFTRLRREQDLTYGASAKLLQLNSGSFVLDVNSTVPKQHARTAMASLLEVLQDAQDGFGPKTFETHKKAELASLRADEGIPPLSVTERAEGAFFGALSGPGIDVLPEDVNFPKGPDRHRLGRATAAQFAKDAGNIIDLSSMKVFAAGALADGGAALRAGMRDAGLDTKGLTMNPVDLKPYKDMGLRVTKETVPPLD